MMRRFLLWIGFYSEPVVSVDDTLTRETEKINFAVEALRAQAQLMKTTAKETDRMRREVFRQ